MFIASGSLSICLIVNYDIDKDLNIFLSLPNEATPMKLKNNLMIILGSKPENFMNIKARKSLVFL